MGKTMFLENCKRDFCSGEKRLIRALGFPKKSEASE